ncbi:polyhydroxyalkanoate synthesis regulator phasin [Oxalobacteraceae bacterium GrIS 1.11]
MSNSNGWGLTARLISKHFGVLGDRVSEAIANFDPETATEADRDRLADTLRATAQKLASARASFDKEHADVVNLRNLIANDEKATETLGERLAAGKISEATINMFCDELEANKAKLPLEIQEEADAQQYMDELQKIVDALSKQLADFDASAKKALQALAAANAQKDLQSIRSERQSQLAGLQGMQGHSSALDALTRRAQTVSNEAAGMRIVADIGQRPIDQAAEIDAIRKSVSQPDTAGESALERLKRLSNKSAA